MWNEAKRHDKFRFEFEMGFLMGLGVLGRVV